MKLYDQRGGTGSAAIAAAFAARLTPVSDVETEIVVRAILEDVRKRGDQAVLEYTQRFDCPTVTSLRVPEETIAAATERVQATPLWDAMVLAADRIRTFHEKQRRESWVSLARPGETLGQILRPLSRVGVYAPAGVAGYPSTVLMAAIPGHVAGVPEIALATPPLPETGLPADATLAAAKLAGVTEVYTMGGAQAIAALAFGTESASPVVKIVGPGNRFVNLAKRLVFGTVGIDMLAGPSEVAVLADDTADAETVAVEIIAQTEHDPVNAALLATTSERLAQEVLKEIEKQLRDLPRAEIVREALRSSGFIALCDTLEDAIAVVNRFAPEHLHLLTAEPWAILPRIENAGAILVGPYSTAALGDYVAGPCHTLPTAGSARFSSPLNVDDFVKKTNLIALDEAAARSLAPAAMLFSEAEGFAAHGRSAGHVLKPAKIG